MTAINTDLRCLLDNDDEGMRSFAVALAWLISNTSEDCYCSSWDSDCEHVLWDAAHSPGSFRYGMGEVSRETLDAMLVLSDGCGCWVRHLGTDGVQPVPMHEWEKIHAWWKEGRR